jgi:CheY-like chemotaxis protein
MNSGIKSILLIDDDQDDKYFFATALEEVDQEVVLHTAGDGIEGLARLEILRPDLIMADLIMPRMNGLAFLKELSRKKNLKHIPVVIYTANLSIFDEQELKKLGAGHVYIKPVDYDSTVSRIREILNTEVYLKSA